MRKRLNKLIKHPLVSGGMVNQVGSIAANVLNYLFNVAMGRFLSVSDYGTLVSLVSILNIFSVFGSTIILVFTKFTASLVGQNKEELIGVLFRKGSIIVGVLALIITGAIAIASGQIAGFLHIKEIVLINLIAASLFIFFVSSVAYGILQGLLKFVSFSIINILMSLIKLVFGIGLILLGFKLFGVVFSIFLSSFLGYFLIFPPLLKFLSNSQTKNLAIPHFKKRLYSYALPVFLSSLGMTVFTSIDIILVKHYMSETLAGQYSALSLMGRSIFYTVSPISAVLFPLVAQKIEKGEKLFGTVLLSVFLVGVPSVILSIIYFFFPQLILFAFFPQKEYASLASYLGPFSIFILFFSLTWLFNSFYLSIGDKKVFIFSLSGAIAESLFIIFFHQSIAQIVTGLIVISFLLLSSLLLYYPYATRRVKTS